MTLQLGGGGAITGCTLLQEPVLIVSGITVNGDIAAPKMIVASGTEALPSYTFSGDVDTGLYTPAANTVAISTNGSERLRVDNDGRLLIGTTTARGDFYNASTIFPFVQVQGTGNERIVSITAVDTGSSSGGSLVLAKSRSTGNTIVQDGDSLGAIQFQGADGSEIVDGAQIKVQVDGTPGADDMPGRLMFSTTADGAATTTERMRIDNAGRVTLKNGGSNYASEFQGDANQFVITNNGACGLTIDATSATNSSIYFADGTTGDESYRGFLVYNHADDSLRIGTSGDEQMRIDSVGNVGIGTSSLDAELHVAGSDPHIDIGPASGNRAKVGYDSNNIYIATSSSVGQTIFKNNVITTDSPAASGTERMRIDSVGNVGIGIPSPQTKLHLSGTTNGAQATFGISNSGLKISTFQKTSNDAGVILDAQEATNGTLAFSTRGNERMRIDSSGRLLVGVTIGTSSGKGVVQFGAGTLISNSASLPNNGSLDITIGTSNVCYWTGFFFVNNIDSSNGASRTQSTYSVFGNNQQPGAVFNQIATANGQSGGRSFTVGYIDNGIIRVTNTSGNTCNVAIGFFGGGINMT